jgi:hypothetical protein
MYIKFDTKRLEMIVMCGPMEEYKPDRETKAIFNKMSKLKKKTQKKLEDIFGDIKISEMAKEAENDKQKKAEWAKYLDEEYNPEVKELIERINKKNEKFCPGLKK